MQLLDRPARLTIRDIRPREFERPPAVIPAAGVELRGVIRESEEMSLKKLLKANSRGVELSLGLLEPCLRDRYIAKPPPNVRVAARKCWQ
jgi:hypothetical protein